MSAHWERLAEATRVKPGFKVNLAKDFDPGRHDKRLQKDHGAVVLADAKTALLDLQDRFFAQADRSLLIILQAIDAALHARGSEDLAELEHREELHQRAYAGEFPPYHPGDPSVVV